MNVILIDVNIREDELLLIASPLALTLGMIANFLVSYHMYVRSYVYIIVYACMHFSYD